MENITQNVIFLNNKRIFIKYLNEINRSWNFKYTNSGEIVSALKKIDENEIFHQKYIGYPAEYSKSGVMKYRVLK